MTKQSDDISFLLAENVHIKQRLSNIETDIAGLKTDVAELKQGQMDMNGKLDLILGKLQ